MAVISQLVAIVSQLSLPVTTSHEEQSEAVSDAAVVGGSIRYALVHDIAATKPASR